MKITVAIPTRNRPLLLLQLLNALSDQTKKIDTVIVVDSSDHDKMLLIDDMDFGLNIVWHSTNIKSAAVQRNIALDMIEISDLVVFLDDDVVPESTYIEKICSPFSDSSVIGVSGIARSPDGYIRKRPSGAIGLFKRVFFLDSIHDGNLLRSGIPVPIRETTGVAVDVEWLIGCAAWRTSSIATLRFETDFIGGSLGEDVIFSARAKQLGRLVVLSGLILPHLESQVSRENTYTHWKSWVLYRRRLHRIFGAKRFPMNLIIWSSLGQSMIGIVTDLMNFRWSLPIFQGIVAGLFRRDKSK